MNWKFLDNGHVGVILIVFERHRPLARSRAPTDYRGFDFSWEVSIADGSFIEVHPERKGLLGSMGVGQAAPRNRKH